MGKMYHIAIIMYLICLGSCNPNQNNQSDQGQTGVMVAAHRGDWRNAPENSIMAIENCIKMGVEIVEVDVRLTRDSVLVLLHDRTLDRTTTGKGNISEWAYDSLQSLFLKNGAGIPTENRIPTLKEALMVSKGKVILNLDKTDDYLIEVYSVVRTSGSVDWVIFKGRSPYFQMQEQYGPLMDSILYMPIITEKTPDIGNFIGDYLGNMKPYAFELVFETDTSEILEYIDLIENNNTKIWINTLWGALCAGHNDDKALSDPDQNWGWIINTGADIIQTDRPIYLLNYLNERGYRD